MPANDQFRQQLESLYRGEQAAKPSRPIVEEPFRGTNTTQAANAFERSLQNEDGARSAAVERNNAIQDQQQRQIQANKIRQQELDALDRLRRSRLTRDPLELRERIDPRPRTEGITQVGGGGTGRSGGGSGGGGTPRSGPQIPRGAGFGGANVPGGVPGTGGTVAPSIPSALNRARIQLPPGVRGPLALGIIGSLPTELPRLMGLLSNPQQYWREQEAQRRRELPSLYPRANTAQTGFASARLALPVPPFSGGQSAGIAYRVVVSTRAVVTTTASPPDPRANATYEQGFEHNVTGPITGIGLIVVNEKVVDGFINAASGLYRVNINNQAASETRVDTTITNISVLRVDGNPDTGGNPAPVVDPAAPRRPAIAPPNAPFSPPERSRTPNAVPFNAPQIINPQTGDRIAPNTGSDTASRPAGAPVSAPNPFSPAPTVAPTPDPNQQKKVTPSNPLAPAPAPTAPAASTAYSDPLNTVRRQGQDLGNGYEESYSDYQQRLLGGAGSGATGNIPGLLPAIAGSGLLLDGMSWNQPRTTRIPSGGTTPGTSPGSAGDPDVVAPPNNAPNRPGFCKFQDDPYSKQANQRAGRIELLNLAMQDFQNREITSMQNKLGPQLPNGGIGGKLGRLGQMASKTWNFLQIDRALAVFTWIGVLHNAYMLSNNLGQTLFSAISNGLDAIGIQKVDDDGNEEPYDVGEIVSKYTDNFAKSVFGTSTWEGIKADWKKLNRIYQAATNLLNSLQSMTYAMLEGLETVGNYTAKIGNAARIFGVFTEKAFNPMKDNLNFKGGRFFRFLERTEEFVENIDSIASSVVDIQQTAADCSDQKVELTKALEDFEKSKGDEEKQKKTNSTSPPITPADQQKPDT